ncbi:transmembrane protein, putative [Medicago truncatula]|uniref:Transmembrane protein, putative n=1 Tax=Medicago truncatula TaxID=3880 RepID=A0A072VPD7_MEDTR|nr:transmembrane protein, putative [Medicago truncatula]
MKFDIKDVEGFLAIKGYVNWAASVLDSSLCIFIPLWIIMAYIHIIKYNPSGQMNNNGVIKIQYLFTEKVRV